MSNTITTYSAKEIEDIATRVSDSRLNNFIKELNKIQIRLIDLEHMIRDLYEDSKTK